MAGDGSAAAVYDARLRRVALSGREQQESDLRWLVFSRRCCPGRAKEGAMPLQAQPQSQPQVLPPARAEEEAGGARCLGLDPHEGRRTAARQRHVDAALRALIDLPCLRHI